MAIGSMRCVVVNVTDLKVGYEFWSAVTGYEVIESDEGWHGWLGYLGTPDPWKHEMILIKCDSAPIETEPPTHHRTNSVHIDITPEGGVDLAIARILEIGGTLKKPASLYPRPGTFDGEPVIDWAVMQDPFGNEFCLVHELSQEQSQAAMHAFARGITSDAELRAAAGQTSPR